MKLIIIMIFLFLMPIYSVKASQEINVARKTLLANGKIVKSHKLCPKADETYVSFPTKYLSAKIDKKRSAVVVFTELCNGGNMAQEFLVLIEGSKGMWLQNADIGDLNFYVESISADKNEIFLKGQRWKDSDPHCCPSLDGILSYNIDTQKQRFSSQSDTQPQTQEYKFNEDRINTQNLILKPDKAMETLSNRIHDPSFQAKGNKAIEEFKKSQQKIK